jgi:hypothetical protein
MICVRFRYALRIYIHAEDERRYEIVPRSRFDTEMPIVISHKLVLGQRSASCLPEFAEWVIISDRIWYLFSPIHENFPSLLASLYFPALRCSNEAILLEAVVETVLHSLSVSEPQPSSINFLKLDCMLLALYKVNAPQLSPYGRNDETWMRGWSVFRSGRFEAA